MSQSPESPPGGPKESWGDCETPEMEAESLRLTVPSESLQPTEDDPEQYPLEYNWVWWFDKGAGKGIKTQDWTAGLVEVGEFHTVFGFWNYWRSLCDSLLFPMHSNLRLFKKGIAPTWEDPANRGGGQFVIWVPNSCTGDVWNEVVLAVIGEQIEFSDFITGVVLAVRPDKNRIAIWNRAGIDDSAIEIVVNQLQMLIFELDPKIIVEHKLNKVAVDFNKNFRQRKSRKKGRGKAKSPQAATPQEKAAPSTPAQPPPPPLTYSSSESSQLSDVVLEESTFWSRQYLLISSSVFVVLLAVIALIFVR